MGNISSIFPGPPAGARGNCNGCGLSSWCLPADMSAGEFAQLERATEHRRILKRDHALFHAGDPLESLYIVNSGSVKTTVMDVAGRFQVTGFPLPGDLVGIEAIDGGRYPSRVTALEDSTCCGVRYDELMRLSQVIPAPQLHVHRMMSREISRD